MLGRTCLGHWSLDIGIWSFLLHLPFPYILHPTSYLLFPSSHKKSPGRRLLQPEALRIRLFGALLDTAVVELLYIRLGGHFQGAARAGAQLNSPQDVAIA